jgi:NhaP-type Na+/H+ or K+/H+ antiporter
LHVPLFAAVEFDVAALVLGALLIIATLSVVRLPLAAVFVVVGFALGQGGLEILDFEPTSHFVHDVAIVALIVILFRDGLEVESQMLQRAWHLPTRKLVVAMPLTCVIVALAAHALTDLSWAESFLIGAILSPTDPVLSSSVVTNPRVPRVVRHSLNLESGLNDGLALPGVLAFMAIAAGDDDFVWWRFVLQDVGLGFAVGIACGVIAALALPPAQRSLYGLGVAFATYGLAVLVDGNGLIAVFVAAITLAVRRHDATDAYDEDIVEVVKLGIFTVFGALLTFGGLFGWAALALTAITLLVARPVAIAVSLLGTRLPFYLQAFMAWFGPKGVATMTFALLALAQGFDEIFNLAALCAFASILAHGLTDKPGSEWVANRSERPVPER